MIQSETQSVSTFLFINNFYLDNAIFDIHFLIWRLIWEKWCKFENTTVGKEFRLAEGVTGDLIRANEGIIDAYVLEVRSPFFG